MRIIRLGSVNDMNEWRDAARALLLAAVPPEDVRWDDPASAPDLFAARAVPPALTARRVGIVPRRFLALGAAAICHAGPDRFALLYSLLWRLQRHPALLASRDDPEVARLHRRADAVLKEAARMHRALRFRRAAAADGHKGHAAWFEPAHFVLERVAPCVAREVEHGQWRIATPYRTAFWDGRILSFGPGGRRPGASLEE